MRGEDERSGSLFSYVDLEARVGKDHPLRTIRGVVNEALASLSSEFSALYALMGRPSIPPEKLLRAMLLQVFYTIRSERQLMERLEFDLLFRWFVGMGVDDRAWDHSTFSKNRERLLEGDVAAKLLSAVMAQPRVKRLLSCDHFSVDGTLIEAWASMKSFRPRDGSDDPPPSGGGRNREADFRGQKRSNETHASTTDPEARLYRKGPGKEAKLCLMGHEVVGDRRPHDATRGLCGEPTHPQADRGSLRLDQEGRRPGTEPSFAAVSASDSGLHLRSRRLQSCSAAEASGGLGSESPGQLPTDRPLADRRVRSLGSSSSRSERPGDADDHRARRRNRLRRLGGRSRSRIRPRLDRFPLGRMRGRR